MKQPGFSSLIAESKVSSLNFLSVTDSFNALRLKITRYLPESFFGRTKIGEMTSPSSVCERSIMVFPKTVQFRYRLPFVQLVKIDIQASFFVYLMLVFY